MSRDALYSDLRASFERGARPEAREALAWVMGGMGSAFGSPALAEFVRFAATDPLRLSEAHFERLRAEGFDDAALFELVTAAAVGIGLARRERALAALRAGVRA